MADHAHAPCDCGCEELEDKELQAKLEAVLAQWKDRPGALIPILQQAQTLVGYLPEPVLKRIALALGKPYSEVAGVVSFYSFFSTTPRGKHVVRVCMGTACYVRGGQRVLETLKKKLGVDVGGTTGDRAFTLEIARCFGACGLAPVLTVNDEVHHRVKVSKIDALLAPYREKAAAR